MQRRKFLNATGAGMAGILAAGAAPAYAQAQPEIKWRLASSFPKSLDTIFASGDSVAKRVAAATNGKFQIQSFAAGEIVPGLQVLDAVQNGTVQCGHTASYYYIGKDAAFALGTTIPFGLNARQFNAWWYAGGADKLVNEFFKEYGVYGLLCGNTGAQMGGWYRKEIKSLADLKGLKMRTSGLAGQIFSKLGVVTQQIAGGEIYSALEKGTIDAAEWVGPYDDEKLGFHKVAKYYYYTGWWEGGPGLHLMVNQKAWDALPKDYQNVLEAACFEGNALMLARYDAGNPPAIKRLVGSGAILKPFPKDMMDAAYKVALDLYAETSAKNAKFKKLYDHMVAFRNDSITWMRFTENTFDDYMASAKK